MTTNGIKSALCQKQERNTFYLQLMIKFILAAVGMKILILELGFIEHEDLPDNRYGTQQNFNYNALNSSSGTNGNRNIF